MAQVCSTIFGYSFFLKLCILCFFGFQENRLLFHSIVPAFRNVIDVPLVVRGLRKSRSEVCILLEKDILSQQNSLFLIHMFQLWSIRWERNLELRRMLRCSFLILGDRWVTYHIGGLISLGHLFLFSHVVMLCGYFWSAYVSSAPISVDSDSFSSQSLFAMKWCSLPII